MTSGATPAAVAVFVSALAARHLAQIALTRARVRGVRSGFVSTALLFLCYTSGMALALRGLVLGAPPAWAIASGSGLWLAAVALRMWALAHLRGQFSSFIEIREDHRLVTDGPYSIVRHPLHLAFGLEVGSFALLAWTGLAAAPAAAVWAVLLVRNRTEEAALARHFGEEYETYRSRTGALSPARWIARLLRARAARPSPQDTRRPGR